MMRAAALAAASLAGSPALAQIESAAPSAGSLLQATLGLALVLGLIVAIA